MTTERLLEQWSERLERRFPGYSFRDNGVAAVHPELARTARFLLALLFDVLSERRGHDFANRIVQAGESGAFEDQSSRAASAEEHLRLLNDVSATYRVLLSVLGLAEGYHQYRHFVNSGLGLGRTLASLRASGVSAERCAAAIKRIEIRLVATAHPTNIFRSIVLGTRREIFTLIRRLNEPVAGEAEFAQLVASLREVIRDTGIEPGSLQLELGERDVMRDVPACAKLMQALRAVGVRLAMDGFGTGTSSLGSLRGLPFDVVKIDRSFVHGLESGRDVTALVHATVTLVENLGMTSVAVGVDSAAQVAVLQALGCRNGQGDFFGAPVAGGELLERFAAQARIRPPSTGIVWPTT